MEVGCLRGFITVIFFSPRTTGFHSQAECFELNFFKRKTFLYMVNQAGVIILKASQFDWCLDLNKAPSA